MENVNSELSMDKKELLLKDALEVCFILFKKNIEEQALKSFKNIVAPKVDDDFFVKEWYGFILSAIYYGFAKSAPAYMVLEFIRSIKYMLKTIHYSDDEILNFLDNQFQAYIALAIEDRLQQYPVEFFMRLTQKKLQDIEKKQVSILSGAMAMFVATCVDTFENYTYRVE